MSFYNMMFGMNSDLIIIISCILNKRIDKVFPRFRDVFLEAEDCLLKKDEYDYLIYTRMGGGNYQCWNNNGICSEENIYYKDEDGVVTEKCPYCKLLEIEKDTNYIGGWDDDFDCTYRTLAFKLSSNDKDKLKMCLSGDMSSIKENAYILFSDIKDKLDKFFNKGSAE